ncbi:hypothetical protein L602_000200001830 [Cupriavidus gilardii J11]|uniref:Uncharacterized protein n=1 Tax=Cupriavidus gilardii J11 TaxID=936133 RepID=A0A562BNV4_9BURK|nr:hypothetical protein [Cupriavidus gilardii]TWG86782.1 hypothetical protein L602_000200001830 [Cupriavidus gilardii J11]
MTDVTESLHRALGSLPPDHVRDIMLGRQLSVNDSFQSDSLIPRHDLKLAYRDL